MKILMVPMSMNIGGAETHILELCRELRRMNHHVTLASFGGVYAEEAAQCGVVNVQLPLHTKKPGAVMEPYRGLEKLIRVGNFDLVHAHARIPAFIKSPHAAASTAMRAAIRNHVPGVPLPSMRLNSRSIKPSKV